MSLNELRREERILNNSVYMLEHQALGIDPAITLETLINTRQHLKEVVQEKAIATAIANG